MLDNHRAEYGKQIVAQLARQITWSHFIEVLPLKDDLQREFYITLAASERSIELKKGRFKAQYKGQMELYLRWLEANEMEPGEESPLGLLLCTEGSEEQIELLQLDKAGIKVAQYLTELPPRHVLMQQIQKSLEIAKEQFDNYCEEEV